MGKFIISKRRDNQYDWRLKASNGETLCHSEGYTTKQAAQKGIESCKENAPSAEIVDET